MSDEIKLPKIHQQRNKPHKPSDWTYYSGHSGIPDDDIWSGDPLAHDGYFIFKEQAETILGALKTAKAVWEGEAYLKEGNIVLKAIEIMTGEK